MRKESGKSDVASDVTRSKVQDFLLCPLLISVVCDCPKQIIFYGKLSLQYDPSRPAGGLFSFDFSAIFFSIAAITTSKALMRA